MHRCRCSNVNAATKLLIVLLGVLMRIAVTAITANVGQLCVVTEKRTEFSPNGETNNVTKKRNINQHPVITQNCGYAMALKNKKIFIMSKYTTYGETPVKFECSKKKCKWQGTIEEQATRKTSNISKEYVCPNCGNNEFYGLIQGLRFTHIETGNTGEFVKVYKPTGKPYTMQIRLDDGSIYFAPKSEFKQCTS